jgi:hypothetical protein
MIPYIFRRGEDIVIELDAPEDNISSITSIEAHIRLQKNQTLTPGDPAPLALVVIPRPSTSQHPNGWSLKLSANQSAHLIPNNIYVVDAKLVTNGSVDITSVSAMLKVTESASSPV